MEGLRHKKSRRTLKSLRQILKTQNLMEPKVLCIIYAIASLGKKYP